MGRKLLQANFMVQFSVSSKRKISGIRHSCAMKFLDLLDLVKVEQAWRRAIMMIRLILYFYLK